MPVESLSSRRGNSPESTSCAEPRNRLEEEVIADDLDERERPIGIEPLRRHRRIVADVASTQFCGPALNHVDDALLWLEPLVEVLVTGEDHVHTVLEEQGFHDALQIELGPMPLA